MEILQITVDALSGMITKGLKPIPALFGFSVFDIAGSLRLALVLEQIRRAERAKTRRSQNRPVEQSQDRFTELEEQSLVTDIVTILVVVYGGEMICSPWLQFTPSFLTMPSYPALFAVAQVLINYLPVIPSMSIHTELPLSFFDALTRAFLLTTGNPGFVLKHASPAVASSPWALLIASLVMANGGFFLVNLFQMLSPYGWHVKTPPEFLPGGWRTMDLWVAPLITGVHALLTHSQAAWVPYHMQLLQRGIGSSTMFGSVEYTASSEIEGTVPSIAAVKPMGEANARSVCALILLGLFTYRAIVNFGVDWARASAEIRVKRKRIIRSKHDGKRMSKENLKIPAKSG